MRMRLKSTCGFRGAGVVGVVATWILPTTLEDVLAVTLAGLAGYVALLNLPLRRAEAKGKLEKVANNFIQVRSSLAVGTLAWQWLAQVKHRCSVQCTAEAAVCASPIKSHTC